jgi:hypothetical protein
VYVNQVIEAGGHETMLTRVWNWLDQNKADSWLAKIPTIFVQGPYFQTFMEPRNWLQGMNSASQCSLAGRYDNTIPARFLAPIDFLKIPAQYCALYKLIFTDAKG